MAARQVIAPRLGRFHRAHPDVTLDIVVDDTLSDIVAGRFDAGIRVGGRLEKDMIAVRLTPDVKMIAVASPAYLAHRGTPRTPDELHSHDCINWRLQLDGRAYRWEFEKKGKRIEVAVEGPVVTNHSDIGVAAALQGLGIAYAFDRERVDEHLARGRLVQVLADWSITRPGLFLYHPSRATSQPHCARSSTACWTRICPQPPARLEAPCLLDSHSQQPLLQLRPQWLTAETEYGQE